MELQQRGHQVKRKRVCRLMQQMVVRAPRTSQAGKGHKIYPLSGEKTRHHTPESGLSQRHLLYSDGQRIHVSGRDPGWVFAAGLSLTHFEHPRHGGLRPKPWKKPWSTIACQRSSIPTKEKEPNTRMKPLLTSYRLMG